MAPVPFGMLACLASWAIGINVNNCHSLLLFRPQNQDEEQVCRTQGMSQSDKAVIQNSSKLILIGTPHEHPCTRFSLRPIHDSKNLMCKMLFSPESLTHTPFAQFVRPHAENWW